MKDGLGSHPGVGSGLPICSCVHVESSGGHVKTWVSRGPGAASSEAAGAGGSGDPDGSADLCPAAVLSGPSASVTSLPFSSASAASEASVAADCVLSV